MGEEKLFFCEETKGKGEHFRRSADTTHAKASDESLASSVREEQIRCRRGLDVLPGKERAFRRNLKGRDREIERDRGKARSDGRGGGEGQADRGEEEQEQS